MDVHVVWGLLLLNVCHDVAAETIMETLNTRFETMIFSSLIQRAGLESLLNTGNYTVFAPVDAAFQLLPKETVEWLYQKENLPQMTALIKYHIVPYTGNTHRNWTGETLNTLASKPVRMVTYPHNQVTVVNGVVLTESNLSVSNGHIYLLRSTLSPLTADVVQSLSQDPMYSSFLTAAALSGMTNKLKEDNITVFAPHDLSFSKMGQNRTDVVFNNISLLRELVEFHILPGVYYSNGLYKNERIRDDNSRYDITYTVRELGNHNFRITPYAGTFLIKDWLASNGVIHAVNGVAHSFTFYRDVDKLIG
ncbi:transforming growth factor-beta-induced protein ig-h3-like [Haliotis cracherodii]|uniref:transforming growth factor-beta-induced protein ig-h3-like n=1 Tax=Haliotis cracherodii TaxID=6455 RepID=UPI0039EA654C